MRYSTPIYFINTKDKVFNSDTGNWDKTETKEKVFADVTDASDSQVRFIFGELRKGCYTVRIRGKYGKPFEYIELNGVRYKAAHMRKPLTGQTYIIYEE